MLVNFTGLPELQHLPCRATMALKTFPLNVVLVMNFMVADIDIRRIIDGKTYTNGMVADIGTTHK